MDRQRYALVVALLLWLPGAAVGQISLKPEAGVLLLRNGHVISGLVTRAGDYYIVTLNAGSEIRERASEVEAFCGSLDEAYEFKERHLGGPGIKPHLDLAEWCLRQNLHGRCAQQLVAAMMIDPDNERLKHLERRLDLAVTPPPPPAPAPRPAEAKTLAAPDQIEKTLAALPPGSVERFTAVVQPILTNRCGANQCHGPAAKTEFRLLRPPEGQITSRRFTQRNLYAALGQLNLDDPEASPLLKVPQAPHGAAVVPIFDKQSQNQLDELLAWAKMTAPQPPPQPATVGQPPAAFSQPASAVPASTGAGDFPIPPRVGAMRPPLDGAVAGDSAPGAAAAPRTFAPRDRYDPEIFNRRFHGK